MTAVADLPSMLARFAASLRSAGLHVDVASLEAYASALRTDDALAPFALYWYARLTLLRSRDDVPAFDRVFAAFWNVAREDVVELLPADARGASVAGRAHANDERESDVAVGSGDERDDAEERRADSIVTASGAERLRERDFAGFSDEEWRIAERLMRATPAPEEFRATRRAAIRRHGRRLDVGATLREERRTFGLRMSPRYRVRKRVVRPLAFICDVSGSMAPYGRALLQYAYVLAQTRKRVSAFAFGTQLTDLTDRFTRRSRRGFAPALRAIPDWGGGTLIGATLRDFNRRFAMQGRIRGATLLFVSDGAERGDPALVEREMLQLKRAVRRIVWLNPRKSDPAYEPLVRGMKAALPSIDVFLSGHNLRSLNAVAAAIRGNHVHEGTSHR